MRIGIDARFYGPIGKGLGRYTQKLIESLEKIDRENQYYVFLKSENFDEYEPKNPNFQKVLADFRWYTLSEQIKYPKLLRRYKLDLVHFPHFNVPIFYFGKFIVTIHDLILLNFPTVRSTTLSPILYWFKFWAYKIVINSAIYRSNRIIAVSKFTKNDILKNYSRIPQEKIKVTYEACDEYCFFNPQKEEKVLERYGIMKPYFLYVGNAYPHKNPERLMRAFKKLEHHPGKVKIVFVGADDYFYQRLKILQEEEKINNVVFAGFVPDYDLDLIFRKSVAYIRPSFYEGFELPPLEAMARGVPVICSDHSCAKEILQDSARYFEAKDTDDLVRAVEEVFENEKLREDLIQKGYEQVKKYSWKNMAEKTLEIYKNIKI
jgi:glycosyltransferase involved in cell wall biosynthesis